MSPTPVRLTVPDFVGLKAAGRKITMLTAYDYPMAQLLDESGVEAILVGDSLSMVVQGHDHAARHARRDDLSRRDGRPGRQRRWSSSTCRFPRYHLGVHKAVENAGRILKETRCQAVKLEGGAEQAEVIAGLVAAGIPVMAHCRPAAAERAQLGGYKRAARSRTTAGRRRRPPKRPARLPSCWSASRPSWRPKSPAACAFRRSASAPAPAATARCWSCNDLLGLTGGHVPRFVKKYADLRSVIQDGRTRRYATKCEAASFLGPATSVFSK